MSDTNRGRATIFGEVLFDRFPDGQAVLGGAPFNVAWHLQAFAQSPLMISRVGDDELGRRIKQAMENWKMDVSALQLDTLHPTGTVDVSFTDGEPAYDIVRDRAYDFIDAESLPSLPDAGVLYHGSLALRNEVSRQSLEQLRQRSGASVFIDVNLRDPWWSRDRVLALLQGARWAKMNTDELALLLPGENGLERRAQVLIRNYSLDWLVVTLGGKGAQAVTAAGQALSVQPDKAMEVVDTVGAGDAFASVLMLGLVKDWPMDVMLERAQAFASSLVGRRGATVDDPTFYRPFCADWNLL